ncbi:hypothetical protein EGN72_03300 [Pseudorhodobacter sp. E13]|uniref:hypothetical protein n=1 Tax=Pseudorhodobacter sp. E13 TaxID=2487931 RepID=UPI000F8F2C4E|nr:hypothetical protein [Pseudorhodobacter sp. E13]RUS63592.1 hypothetical protein EGN72_03300 [Pseudorhodobacter sp. E13]
MRKTLTTFVVATALTASAFAVSAQEQTTPETGEMMQNDDAMQSGMMDGDMMGMMKMMAEMKPMMEACTEMMASMTEKMDGDMMPSEKSDG